MPKKRRPATPILDSFEEEYDEDASSSSSGRNQPPIQRNAANARERARMRVLSSAFSRLKTKLPNIPPDTKLSKLDTLRLATIYIQQLKAILDGEPIDETLHNFTNQQHLTWPFTFQQMPHFCSQFNQQFSGQTMNWSNSTASIERFDNDILYTNHHHNIDNQHHHRNHHCNSHLGINYETGESILS